jgi:hypothetical protein
VTSTGNSLRTHSGFHNTGRHIPRVHWTSLLAYTTQRATGFQRPNLLKKRIFHYCSCHDYSYCYYASAPRTIARTTTAYFYYTNSITATSPAYTMTTTNYCYHDSATATTATTATTYTGIQINIGNYMGRESPPRLLFSATLGCRYL